MSVYFRHDLSFRPTESAKGLYTDSIIYYKTDSLSASTSDNDCVYA
jgi:hypothetical protein